MARVRLWCFQGVATAHHVEVAQHVQAAENGQRGVLRLVGAYGQSPALLRECAQCVRDPGIKPRPSQRVQTVVVDEVVDVLIGRCHATESAGSSGKHFQAVAQKGRCFLADERWRPQAAQQAVDCQRHAFDGVDQGAIEVEDRHPIRIQDEGLADVGWGGS